MGPLQVLDPHHVWLGSVVRVPASPAVLGPFLAAAAASAPSGTLQVSGLQRAHGLFELRGMRTSTLNAIGALDGEDGGLRRPCLPHTFRAGTGGGGGWQGILPVQLSRPLLTSGKVTGPSSTHSVVSVLIAL